ncbi:hypothetical protein [Altererythrobacter sp. Root672]|uniref:hypothetical protein n=1 Tax=Altererythrobacter sp. Root672 TaxID=1736584 RepID=UPI0006F96774|nr:hypothetical protein [Altererythrobacter sp. Root672]KRA83631.1 hypothetical protein ASD76_06255 [Altererythrobacter sp. Root672]
MATPGYELQGAYLARAAKDHASARAEVLHHVRHKHMTSAASWERLALLAAETLAAREARLFSPDV